jgi:hypothetical protein
MSGGLVSLTCFGCSQLNFSTCFLLFLSTMMQLDDGKILNTIAQICIYSFPQDFASLAETPVMRGAEAVKH